MDKLHEHVEQACRRTIVSAAISTTWSTRVRSSSSTSSPAGRCPIATGARDCTRPSRPRRACSINQAADHAAQITFQSYFGCTRSCAGMTGTAAQNRWEMRRVYKIWVVCVPTNRPCIRARSGPTASFQRGRQVRRRGGGGDPPARAGPAGADRHALGGQVGEAEPASDRRRASSIRCSTPGSTSRKRRSSPRPARRAG